MKKAWGTLLLLAPLAAGQAWLWPTGLRAVRTQQLALPERYEFRESINSRTSVRYDWVPLGTADAVRMGWGVQATAAMLGVWTVAVLLYGRWGWTRLRRPLAVTSALFAAPALLLLLPPWRARELPLAGGLWAFLFLVAAVQLVSGPLERRFGKKRMQHLNCLAGGAVLLASAVFFGWNTFFGIVAGGGVIAVGYVHAWVLATPPHVPPGTFPESDPGKTRPA